MLILIMNTILEASADCNDFCYFEVLLKSLFQKKFKPEECIKKKLIELVSIFLLTIYDSSN